MSVINKLLREPLLHFFLLGAGLFLLYNWTNEDAGKATDEIVVDAARVNGLVAAFTKTWSRSPTAEETRGLIDTWVREEVLYREGIAIGFDQNDPIIRRRVAQKMTFISDGLVPEMPGDPELQAWLDANADDYAIPAIYSFSQVYFDPQRHGDDVEAVMDEAQKSLASSDNADWPGDSTMLPQNFTDASEFEIGRVFGQQFVAGLAGLEPGAWQGPVVSGYGLHFVKIDSVIPGRNALLDEVRSDVERDVLNDLSDDIDEAFYQSLLDKYEVRLESLNTSGEQ